MWKKNVMYHVFGTYHGYSLINLNHMVLMVNKLFSLVRLFAIKHFKLYFFFVEDVESLGLFYSVRRYLLQKYFSKMKYPFIFSRYVPGLFSNWKFLYSSFFSKMRSFYHLAGLKSSSFFFPIFFIYRIFYIYRDFFKKRFKKDLDFTGIFSVSNPVLSYVPSFRFIRRFSVLNRSLYSSLKRNDHLLFTRLNQNYYHASLLHTFRARLIRFYFFYSRKFKSSSDFKEKTYQLRILLDRIYIRRLYNVDSLKPSKDEVTGYILSCRYNYLWRFYSFVRNFFEHKLPFFFFLFPSGDCHVVFKELFRLNVPVFSFLDTSFNLNAVSYPMFLNSDSFFLKLYFVFFIQFVYIKSSSNLFFRCA
jgi:ribosomal protein S2